MLTPEFRRAVCFHEAGHAVIHALGGSVIHGLAVAPEGDEPWTYQGRKGAVLENLAGVCEPCDSPWISMYLEWDGTSYRANRNEFNDVHRSMAASLGTTRGKQLLADVRRFVRRRVCGALAGPIAESYYREEEFDVWGAEGWVEPESDVEKAMGLAQLLPYRRELEHACDVTCDAMRRPDIWSRVIALADELERSGNMCTEAIAEFLPQREADWPPSGAARWRDQYTAQLA
ncbi:MAG: hypothetical protein EPN73_02315 [Paraburkholderia sp.]|uniref:hypothetical protein n=1 Tax=Paraburkholderia sp. TaxID=1926495 RepID=UPI00120D7087|nr:hypothetical protein [Paraburkholderia sp.]TAL98766.1 MAG: hypothetical protein EPN73_02315 [Paraburkholderia sp.]